jgi:hypothetical protein
LYPRSFLQPDGLGLMVCSATQAAAPDQIGFDGLQGNAGLLAPLFRDKPVAEILPERTVFAEVNLHGHLAALLIGQKLNAGHDLPLRFSSGLKP